MAGEGKCGLQHHETISDTELCRRQSTVNVARVSVSLESSHSEADAALAQRFIDCQISLREFVQPLTDAFSALKVFVMTKKFRIWALVQDRLSPGFAIQIQFTNQYWQGKNIWKLRQCVSYSKKRSS